MIKDKDIKLNQLLLQHRRLNEIIMTTLKALNLNCAQKNSVRSNAKMIPAEMKLPVQTWRMFLNYSACLILV